ncbi:hypothetical protein [Streptomyces sp. enrichment culture]|uniref:hypothetical protein n=1 Tax=Streptomyces sp. enrichment culture TaxID=1795815 RepID=UPI003F578226
MIDRRWPVRWWMEFGPRFKQTGRLGDGGVTTVPLYSAEDIALVPASRPTTGWHAVHAVPQAATARGGRLVRHGGPYTAPTTACICARQTCGGIIPTPYCADHGIAVEPALEWHPADGIRCTDLTR